MTTRFTRFSKAAIRRTTSFARHDSGAIALVVGLAAVPLFLAAGVALDTFRAGSARADVQASLDAAALAAAAAGPSSSNAERKKMAEDAFEANISNSVLGKDPGKPDIKFDNGTVTVSYNGNMPTTLMTLGGFDKMTIAASSTATLRLPQKAEIALVLDYSGSMEEISAGKVKYQTMKDAAIDMVNGLTEDGENKDVHFGLVPFSHHVYTSLPANMVLGGGFGTWTGCTQDRRYPFNTKVSAPISGNDNTKWNQPQAEEHKDWGCGTYVTNGLKIRELTSDHAGTISQLKKMKPYAWTHISLGLEFGWHVLDEGAPFAARAASDKKNKKFLVLLTDGVQTEPAFGANGSRKDKDGEKNLEKLCDNVKSSDITVITIAFALDDTDTENRLRNCSTDPDKHFFKAEDSNDLTQAFEQIKNQIASAIYLSK